MRVTSVSLTEDGFDYRRVFRKSTIKYRDIERIRAAPMLSLADEVRVTVVTPESEFEFTDADTWFPALRRELNLDLLFGTNWLLEAEQGKIFDEKVSLE